MIICQWRKAIQIEFTLCAIGILSYWHIDLFIYPDLDSFFYRA